MASQLDVYELNHEDFKTLDCNEGIVLALLLFFFLPSFWISQAFHVAKGMYQKKVLIKSNPSTGHFPHQWRWG
jgi:hypothetical protein